MEKPPVLKTLECACHGFAGRRSGLRAGLLCTGKSIARNGKIGKSSRTVSEKKTQKKGCTI